MTDDPTLEGKVTVEFEIGGAGKVTSSEIKSSTLGNPGVEGCIVKAVERWKYPKPKDGEPVKVSYPFRLEPG